MHKNETKKFAGDDTQFVSGQSLSSVPLLCTGFSTLCNVVGPWWCCLSSPRRMALWQVSELLRKKKVEKISISQLLDAELINRTLAVMLISECLPGSGSLLMLWHRGQKSYPMHCCHVYCSSVRSLLPHAAEVNTVVLQKLTKSDPPNCPEKWERV